MVTQIHYNTHSYNNRTYQGITFGRTTTAGNVTDIIAKTWGVTIPPRPEALEAAERLEAFEQLAKKYQREPDMASLILNAPPETWEKVLSDYNKTAAISSLISKHWAGIQSRMREVMNDRRSPAEQYEHVLAHLDTATVIDAFTTAATTLGDDATNVESALINNREALDDYRTNGHKLKALAGLGLGIKLDTEHRGTRQAARYTHIEPLPPLAGYWQKGTMTPIHTTEHQNIHDTIEQAMALADTNIDAYLTRLARGDYPHLTLSIATTEGELKERAMILANVGITNTVPAPKRGGSTIA